MKRSSEKKWWVASAMVVLVAAGASVYFYYARPAVAVPGDRSGAASTPTLLSAQTRASEVTDPAAVASRAPQKAASKSAPPSSSSEPTAAEQRGVSPAFLAWEQRVGYIRPQRYDTMTEAELKALSAAGDMYASQKLADIALLQHNNIPEAVGLYKRSVAQGSLASVANLENLYNPTLAAIAAQSRPELGDFRGDQAEAYLWARIATMRGDADALVAVAEHARGLSPEQVLELERNAIIQYNLLQDQYRQQTGHGFDNQFIDPSDTPLGQRQGSTEGGG